MISRTNRCLAALLVLVFVLAVWSRVDFTRPNYEILPDMKYTVASPAFAANMSFRNGRTLQVPVPGTIAHGQRPWHSAATAEDAVRAGEELQSPYQADADDRPGDVAQEIKAAAAAVQIAGPETAAAAIDDQGATSLAIQQGANVFRVYCIPCHGPGGAGDGVVTTRGFPPPPSLLTGKSRLMKDGQLFHILTFGQGNMAGFAGQLSPDDRWRAVAYVRSLQQALPPTPSTEIRDGAPPVPPSIDEPLQDSNPQSPEQGTSHVSR